MVTYLAADGERCWVFGKYEAGEDIVLHAIEIALRPPDLAATESLEGWLFGHRFEVLRLYDGLRREVAGVPMPLASLRRHRSYIGSFLAAPHRSPA